METPERHLKGSPTAPLEMSWYEEKAKAMMDEVDAWLEHHDKGCPLMARIFSFGMTKKDMQFMLLIEKDGVYYVSVEHAEAGDTPYGAERETGLRPGMPIDAGKYRENGENYLAFALFLSATGYYITLHPDTATKPKPVETVKIQAYFKKDKVEELDAACKKLGLSRAAFIRKVVEEAL